MASRPLSLGWCFTLAALIVSAAGCNCGGDPQPPPVAEQPDAALSKVEVSRTANVQADGRDSVTITVTVVKEDGAALSGRTVRLEASGEGNTLAPASGQTNAQGVFTATLASTSAGTKKVKASVEAEGGPVVLTSQPTVEFVASQTPKLAFTNTSLQGTAGAPLSPEVEVEVQDAQGRRLTSSTASITVALATGPASALLEGTATVSAVEGVARFPGLLLKKAGTGYSLRATSGMLIEATSPTFEVIPAAPAAMKLTGPASVTAGGAAELQVSVEDAFANVARGYTGTVRFTSSDGGAALPGTFTFTAAEAGQKSFSGVTLRTLGTQTVTVTDTATATLTATHSLTVTEGPAMRLEFTVPGGPVTAGTAFSVTVTAYDASNNVATGFTGTVQLSSTDAQAVLPAAFTFGPSNMGTASLSVELRTAGAQTLSLTHGLPGSPLTATKTVVAARGAQLAFSTQPTSGTVRATLAAVRVRLQDAYGNATTDGSPLVSVFLAAGGTAATLSGTVEDIFPVMGEASFDNLSVDQEGSDFRLVATAGTLTRATSAAFTITDNIAPAAAVISAAAFSSSSVRVTWTAVGDDGTLGTATAQEVRYAPTPITTLAEFNAATAFPLPAPQAPGSAESVLVTGVTLSTDQYFAVKIIDGGGNFSLSNSPRVAGDVCLGVTCTPPAAICSADGRSTISYTSACVVNNGVAECQDTPATAACQSFETCGGGSCGPVTAGSQAGAIIISEFSALGSEFIELHNTTAADIDVHGYTLRNAAGVEVDLRAVSDPNGTAGTAVMVTAGGSLYGIANPSGAIPGGVGFVYGAPGTPFSLVDTGDAVALYAAPPSGVLQDAVDFRSFKTDPNNPLTASDFVGFAGSSTQVDPGSLSAAANDTATNWCVSFYGSGVRGSRVTSTEGAANGSCKVAVINEIYLDAPGADDGQGFIELAGPGGSVIGGAKVADVEGRAAPAGSFNAFGQVTLAAGTRFPADGVLLIADLASATGQTLVPNFAVGIDIGLTNVDLENGGGDAVQLVDATGTVLLDAVGQDTAGTPLDTNTATNGLPMYEGGTAFYISTTGQWSSSLARSPGSTDTDNNRNDFRTDPSPTPGLPNDLANFSVATLFPDDGPAAAGANGIAITGTDLAPTMRVQFGSNGSAPCAVSSPTTASCTAVPNGGNAVAVVNVAFTAAASVGAPGPVVLGGAFTYTGTENDLTPTSTLEADYCNLQFPATLTVARSTMTPLIYGRIYELGVTESPGVPTGVLAEVGYGNNGSDPRVNNSWKFYPASYNVQQGNDDEFMGSFLAPGTAATFAYTYRFSQDNGLRWTYCDVNGAGSNAGLTFEAAQLGVMTVN